MGYHEAAVRGTAALHFQRNPEKILNSTIKQAKEVMTKRAVLQEQPTLEEFAKDLTRMLGSAKSKAELWLEQRKQLVKHLNEIRDTASALLSQLHWEEKHLQAADRTAGDTNRSRASRARKR